jgi:hypothetical protein
VDKPIIVYIPRADATSETELEVLASVYRYVLLESNARKEGAPATDKKSLRLLHDQEVNM